MKNIYKIIFLLIFNSAFCILHSFSQQITFQKTYGGTGPDIGISVQQTNDGGYITGGEANQGSFGNNYSLIKTNPNGDTLWTKTYFISGCEAAFSVQQTTDSGYIIVGRTDPTCYYEYYEICLIKTNSNGDTLWIKTLGGGYAEIANSVQQTTDGGYIITGTTEGFGVGYDNVYLIKTDANGDTLWSKTFGGTYEDYGYSVEQTSDGGYIITGPAASFGVGSFDFCLIKTDTMGNLLWTKTYGGTGMDESMSVQQTTDSGYIIAGFTNSFGAGDYDVYLVKTDLNGDTLWTKTFGGTGDDKARSVHQTMDGGYIISGDTKSFGAGNGDIYLIKTNTNGDFLWSRTFGGTSNEEGYCVQQTLDGGYIITGFTWSFGAGLEDVYLIKTDSLGNSGCNEGGTATIITTPPTQVTSPATIVTSPPTVVEVPTTFVRGGGTVSTLCVSVGSPNFQIPNSNLQFSPNPVVTKSFLTFNNPDKEKFLFTLYDITGRVTESVSTTNNEIILTKGSKPAGVYLFNLVNEKTGRG